MDRLAAMQSFIEIINAGSLSAAARRTGRSLASTVRLLAALEAHVGVRLLERTTRRLRLTEEGVEYLERVREVVRLAEEADAAATNRRSKPVGRLTVSAPLVFGRLHVAPRILQLLKREPALSINLFLTDRLVDLVEEGIDAAVRIGPLPDSTLRAVEIGTTRWLYCASPAYLKRAGIPASEADLARHECPSLNISGRSNPGQGAFSFSCNSADVLVQAALAGHGVVRVLSYQVADALRQRRLREVLPGLASPLRPISLIYPQSRLPSARLVAFRDAMIALRGQLDFRVVQNRPGR